VPDASESAGGLVPTLAGFTRRLRNAGVALGTGDVLTYCAAAEPLDPTDLVDLYWAGRTTLVTRHDQIPVYDRVFRAYYLEQGDEDERVPFSLQARQDARAELQLPESQPGEERDEREARLGLAASDVAALKGKSFATCTPEELVALRRIMRKVRLTPPRRRSRRTRAARDGRTPDPRRTVRASLRTHGDPTELWWRRRRARPRPLVLILDVSGSMTDYSRSLLQFAYSARRAAARVEVFCFSSRLTRITRQLEHRRPDEALALAAEAVVDWDGGTRIGDSLAAFVRDWGRRGTSRGAIVVICSDGLDRGDPAVLDKALERLGRLSHRVVWLNPHKTSGADFRPSTLGMIVAAPHVDQLLSGHDLASLEEFAAKLPDLG
jgi:uncharacterized protein with von Willebrand factor type A (vWA) domain